MCACRLPWSRHHPALALSRRLTEALSIFLVSSGEWGSGLGWGGQTLHPSLSLPFCFSTKLDPRRSLVLVGGRGGGVKSPGSPFPVSVFPGQCSSREDLSRGSQSLPCTLMPALCLMLNQPGARGIGEGGIFFFLTSHCRPALFSPSAHPGEQGRWRKGGRTLQAFDDPVQRGCLEAGTPGPSPSVRVTVWHPRRPGPFQSPWH